MLVDVCARRPGQWPEVPVTGAVIISNDLVCNHVHVCVNVLVTRLTFVTTPQNVRK